MRLLIRKECVWPASCVHSANQPRVVRRGDLGNVGHRHSEFGEKGLPHYGTVGTGSGQDRDRVGTGTGRKRPRLINQPLIKRLIKRSARPQH